MQHSQSVFVMADSVHDLTVHICRRGQDPKHRLSNLHINTTSYTPSEPGDDTPSTRISGSENMHNNYNDMCDSDC